MIPLPRRCERCEVGWTVRIGEPSACWVCGGPGTPGLIQAWWAQRQMERTDRGLSWLR